MLTITELANTPVCIEDDAFDEETFFELQVYMNTLDPTKGLEYVKEGHRFYKPLYDFARKEIYNHRVILRDRVTNKLSNLSDDLKDCDFQIYLRCIDTPMEGKIHTDTDWKMLTTMLYVSDVGDGTMFFDSEYGTNIEEVEWKPNRLVSLIPSDTSWHSFKNSGQIARNTVQYILYNKEYTKVVRDDYE